MDGIEEVRRLEVAFAHVKEIHALAELGSHLAADFLKRWIASGYF